jgi:putative phosphoesterase
MRIGVVSDTHGYFDPSLREHLAGVDEIIHAGDVGSQNILDELEQLAHVCAVQGNVDSPDLKLPLTRTLRFEGVQVELRHTLSVPQSEIEKWADGVLLGKSYPRRREEFLKSFDGATRVVVFGHSHQPCLITLCHTLFFNPGSAGHKRFSLPRSFGELEIFPRGIRGIIRSLEGDAKDLPGKVWVPVGE